MYNVWPIKKYLAFQQLFPSFQDKDYPVKALQISELHKEISTLKLANKVEIVDINCGDYNDLYHRIY